MYPPGKGRLVVNLIGYCILCNLKWVGLFDIFQWDPCRLAISPLNEEIPVTGGLLWVPVAILTENVPITLMDGTMTLTMIGDFFKNGILSSFRISLGIDVLCNDIGCIFLDGPILEFNHVGSTAKERIWMKSVLGLDSSPAKSVIIWSGTPTSMQKSANACPAWSLLGMGIQW